MQLVIQDPSTCGTVVWQLPPELAKLWDNAETKLESLGKEHLGHRSEAAEILASSMKGQVIEMVQDEVKDFFELLVKAHLAAKTANPPSKFMVILEKGLLNIRKEMDMATK